MQKGIIFLTVFQLVAISVISQTVKTNDPLFLVADSTTQLTVSQMMKRLPGPAGERFSKGLKHGTMEVLIYAPKGKDIQTFHEKDEVYVVISGSGIFFDGNKKNPFNKGDVLFAPAYKKHRFESFTEDFVTWVIFYGPVGGERKK